jgi:PLP dependent protein
MDSVTQLIRDNLTHVENIINEAAKHNGRSAEEVKLIVVSKKQPVDKIKSAIAAGVRKFGENYPEEAIEKINAVVASSEAIEWHMIGHLQSRKVSIIAQYFSYIHSLDSFSVAEKLSKKLVESQREIKSLLEVNVSGEESKFGYPAWDEAYWPGLVEEAKKIGDLPGIKLSGVMTMPPYFDDPENVRPYFRKTRMLRDYIREKLGQKDFSELSMGTSGDYRVAVEEGATFVRIGQAIMGQRFYQK